MPHSPFRMLRTSLLATTILGLAAGAHLLAGGDLPVPPVMAALLALHLLCATVATRFRITLPVMIGLLASSQIVLHQAFAMMSHGAHMSAAGSDMAAHHTMSADAYAALMMAEASGTESVGHAGAMSGGMWAAHIGATLVAAALLAYGEAALWALANWLRPLYRCAAVVLVIQARTTRPALARYPLPRLPWRNVRPDTRRGPPLRTSVFA